MSEKREGLEEGTVAVSYHRTVQSETHEVIVALLVGEGPWQWSFVVEHRTRRYAGGNEVREAYAWRYHTGPIRFWHRWGINRWLRQEGVPDLCRPVNTTITRLIKKQHRVVEWRAA